MAWDTAVGVWDQSELDYCSGSTGQLELAECVDYLSLYFLFTLLFFLLNAKFASLERKRGFPFFKLFFFLGGGTQNNSFGKSRKAAEGSDKLRGFLCGQVSSASATRPSGAGRPLLWALSCALEGTRQPPWALPTTFH